MLFGTNNTTRLTIAGNGNATFTGTVSGITPTAGAHLTTKTYVDGQIAAAGGDNLGSGGTTSGTLYASNGSNQGFIGQGAQNYARWDSSGTTYYNKNGSWEYTMNATSFSPWTNNANSLGTATKRWSNMYSTLGNFSGAVTAASFVYSSDENLKTNITPLLNAKDILSLGTYTFDWKDGTAGSETKNAQGDIGIVVDGDIDTVSLEYRDPDDKRVAMSNKAVEGPIGSNELHQKNMNDNLVSLMNSPSKKMIMGTLSVDQNHYASQTGLERYKDSKVYIFSKETLPAIELLGKNDVLKLTIKQDGDKVEDGVIPLHNYRRAKNWAYSIQ